MTRLLHLAAHAMGWNRRETLTVPDGHFDYTLQRCLGCGRTYPGYWSPRRARPVARHERPAE